MGPPYLRAIFVKETALLINRTVSAEKYLVQCLHIHLLALLTWRLGGEFGPGWPRRRMFGSFWGGVPCIRY